VEWEDLKQYLGRQKPIRFHHIVCSSRFSTDLSSKFSEQYLIQIRGSVIRQEFSWGCLQITYETFQKIIVRHDIYSPFMDTVRAFGIKTHDDEKVNDCCHGRIYDKSMTGREGSSFGNVIWLQWKLELADMHNVTELCYNIRHFERNNRARGDPWSLRQIGIYHNYDAEHQSSVWIILQPSVHIETHLINALQEIQRLGIPSEAQQYLHVFFFTSVEMNWKEYMESLRERLEILVRATNPY
jgi:hypothetical protein